MCDNIIALVLRICILLSVVAYTLLSVHIWRSSIISPKKPKIANKQCSEYFCSSSKCSANDSIEVSNRWIVLVDPNHSSTPIKKFFSLRGWHVVVVGDEWTKMEISGSDVKRIHLITTQQQQFGFTSQMLSNSHIRKVVGYLYAIRNGAQFIYEVDQDAETEEAALLEEELNLFDYEESVSGLVYSSKQFPSFREKLFNPYTYFYNPSEVSDGLGAAIFENHTNISNGLHLCRDIGGVAVQEGIVSGKGAATVRSGTTNGDDEFNRISLPLTVAPSTFSLWLPKSTIFRYDAFFVLAIPIRRTSWRDEILRSLFIQKLLHIVGKAITFHLSKLTFQREKRHRRNIFDDKLLLEALTFIDSWKCPFMEIAECMLSLADKFKSNGYWEEENSAIIRIWIQNLKSLRYNFPKMSTNEFDCLFTFDESSRNQNCRRASIILPRFLLKTTEDTSERISKTKTKVFQDLTDWCAQANFSESNCEDGNHHQAGFVHSHANISAQQAHLDKVLVIINNHPRRKGIGLLQRLYQPYFAITIFCGSYTTMEYRDEGEFPEMIYPFNYIHVSPGELHQGYFFHYCLAKVNELRLRNVEGYFFTADDAIFHVWHALDLSEILFPVYVIEYRNPSIWWPSKYGRQAAERAARLFTEKYKHNRKINKVLACYQEGLVANGHKEEAVSHITNDNGRTLSDFFYVPEKRMAYLAEVIEVFFEAELFVELTMNKLLQTVPHNRLSREYFKYIPQDSRHRWRDFYRPEKIMVHPIKINEYADLSKRKQFCETIVQVFRQALLDCIL